MASAIAVVRQRAIRALRVVADRVVVFLDQEVVAGRLANGEEGEVVSRRDHGIVRVRQVPQEVAAPGAHVGGVEERLAAKVDQ